MANEVKQETELQDTPTNGGEKIRAVPKQGPAQKTDCDHAGATLGNKFCPDCGEGMPAIPKAAIEQLIDEHLRKLGVIDSDGNSSPADDPEAELREQFADYEAAVKKSRKKDPLFGPSMKFPTYEQFSAASPDDRQKELTRFGITSAPASAAQQGRKSKR